MIGVQRHDAELVGQKGDPGEGDGQDANHPRQRTAGIFPLRGLKRLHTVRDGLHAGQRGAAAAEGGQDEQDAQGLGADLRAPGRGHRYLRHEAVARGAEEAARELEMRIVLRGSSYETEDDRPQLTRLVDRSNR